MNNTKDKTEKKVKIEKIMSPEGCHDILPSDHVFHSIIKKVVRRRARQNGIERISPCLFEHGKLFERAIWEWTDIVDKEIFSFKSKSGKKTYALRPELTAGIIRSYIEHGMASLPQPVRLYSFENVFRYDRPQKNRYRQFYQWSVEIIGERDPGLDAQMINLAFQVLKDLRIDDWLIVKINSLWSRKEREKYEESLKNYFYGKERNLCFDCQNRLEKNPLRILDCKEEDCKLLSEMAPKFSQFLSKESQEYFAEVLSLLDAVKIPYQINETLVRGLDYYNDTTFEIVDASTDSQQDTLLAWWRYDWLVEQLWGKDTPAFGFWLGVERIINRMKDFGYKVPSKDKTHMYVAQLWAKAKPIALQILEQLHNEGIHAMGAIGTPSLKAQLRNADKFNADWAIILWQIEVQEGNAILRNMKEWSQKLIKLEAIIPKAIELIGDKVDKVDFFELNSLIKNTEENWGI